MFTITTFNFESSSKDLNENLKNIRLAGENYLKSLKLIKPLLKESHPNKESDSFSYELYLTPPHKLLEALELFIYNQLNDNDYELIDVYYNQLTHTITFAYE